MTQAARPGDVLADRYRLVDLLSESGGGRFWRAHDNVLDRHVALHCIAEDDERAPGLTEAARLSATVLDRRLLRVLDADHGDGMAYVVNEWGAGTSLDILIGTDGPMPPRRAAWLVSEVAASIAVAHEGRVAHGRLVPETVLLDHGGSVRIIGCCVDAALRGLPPGRISQDVTDLGGLLYYALTGRWAGGSTSAVRAAPQAQGRWLRPRQVRAGIPRVLDGICDVVLNPYAAAPHGTRLQPADRRRSRRGAARLRRRPDRDGRGLPARRRPAAAGCSRCRARAPARRDPDHPAGRGRPTPTPDPDPDRAPSRAGHARRGQRPRLPRLRPETLGRRRARRRPADGPGRDRRTERARPWRRRTAPPGMVTPPVAGDPVDQPTQAGDADLRRRGRRGQLVLAPARTRRPRPRRSRTLRSGRSSPPTPATAGPPAGHAPAPPRPASRTTGPSTPPPAPAPAAA